LATEYYNDFDWDDDWNSTNDQGVLIDNINIYLQDELITFIKEICPNDQFKDALRNDFDETFDFYGWGHSLRYFLMCFEEDQNPTKTIDIDRILMRRDEKKINDYYSVEHLWAVKNRSEEGQNDREKDYWFKRRLGNFALLEMKINIQAGDKDLIDKIDIYFGKNCDNQVTDMKQIVFIRNVFRRIIKEHDDWKRTKNYYYSIYNTFIEKIENSYISFALKRWKIPKIQA